MANTFYAKALEKLYDSISDKVVIKPITDPAFHQLIKDLKQHPGHQVTVLFQSTVEEVGHFAVLPDSLERYVFTLYQHEDIHSIVIVDGLTPILTIGRPWPDIDLAITKLLLDR